MPTLNLELLSLYAPAERLGMTEDGWSNAVANLLTLVPTTYTDQQAQLFVLGEAYELEASRWRGELSGGSGADGSFSLSEISTRMSAAEARRDATRAQLTATLPAPAPSGRRRGSGSVPITFEV